MSSTQTKTSPVTISTRPLPEAFKSLGEISTFRQFELDVAYGRAEPGPMPDGVSKGRALFFPGMAVDSFTSAIASVFWQGKVFHKSEGFLKNRVVGLEGVKAKIYEGKSLYDGKPSLLIDYKKTSWLVPFVQDEIRQVGPKIYLGRAYFKVGKVNRFLLSFALDFT